MTKLLQIAQAVLMAATALLLCAVLYGLREPRYSYVTVARGFCGKLSFYDPRRNQGVGEYDCESGERAMGILALHRWECIGITADAYLLRQDVRRVGENVAVIMEASKR